MTLRLTGINIYPIKSCRGIALSGVGDRHVRPPVRPPLDGGGRDRHVHHSADPSQDGARCGEGGG